MIGVKRNGYRGDGAGFSWPAAAGGGIGVVKDVFGPRPFSPHIATVGYDYDFHRGIDIAMTQGDPLYSPISGAVIRRHYSHFGFQEAAHLSEFTLTAQGAGLSVALGTNALTMTAARVGVQTFPTVSHYAAATERVDPIAADWVIECKLSATPSTVGAIGIGIFNAAKTEYLALEYDGTTFTIRAAGSNVQALNDTTYSVASKTWLRIAYTKTADTVAYQHSTDGATFTTLATCAAGRTFATLGAAMIPSLTWRSGDTNATPYTVSVVQFNWLDESQTIGRFGNWLMIGNASGKIVLVHFQSLAVALGSFVSASQPLGKSGLTGFDARSGRILAEHCHVEWIGNNGYAYSNDDPINPLAPGRIPRANVSNNVAVSRTTQNDPDTVDSWKLTITVTRADQDFDLNTVTLTGNLATRTVNLNTRAGLNVDNDIPKQAGVYIVPSLFDQSSASYVVAVYFNKTVVGSTFTSYVVSDTAGTTLASE